MKTGYQLCRSGGREGSSVQAHLRDSQGCRDLPEPQRCERGLREARAMWRWLGVRAGGGGGVGAAVAQSPQRDASTFRVAAGVEWGAMERARAQWRGHLGTLKPL